MEKQIMNQIMDIIFDKIKSDKDILKLLHFDKSYVDIYAQPNLGKEYAIDTVKNRIYTRKKKPESTVMDCYISMWCGRKLYSQPKNSFYTGNTFTFLVLCHNDIILNDYVGDRTCEIEGKISKIFHDGFIDGFCKTRLYESLDFDLNDYSGRKITIEFNDFNGDTR